MCNERLETFRKGIGQSAMANMELLEADGVMEAVERTIASLIELRATIKEAGGDSSHGRAFILGLVLAGLTDDF